MPQSVDLLARHGFPRGIVEALRKDGVTELLDPQVEAALRFDLAGGEDLLVSLPTSCGKTLIGELAGVGAAIQGRRAVFSVPLKALAREKYELFRHRYAPYGLRVRLATGEFTAHLAALQRGDYDIAVLIHEKLKHLAIREPGFLHGVGVAVLDELQGVEDPSRGPELEFLLGVLKQSSPRIRRVGLVGTLPPDDPLLADFDNRVLTAIQRPIDLRQGIVLADPELAALALAEYGLEPRQSEDLAWTSIYRSHNSGMVQAETLPVGDGEGGVEGDLLRLAVGLATEGEPVLVFLPSRREAEEAALLLAGSAPFLEQFDPPSGIEDLDEETLLFCLAEGIAFHHADLSPRCRAAVEEAFREGRIRILCSTSTLAMGVNLPARNVLIHPFVWNRFGQTGELSLLPEAIVRNMAGRAGRLGMGEDFGRALLVAHTRREWDLYRRCYWSDLGPRLAPSLAAGELGPFLLAGISLGKITPTHLVNLLHGMLSARVDHAPASSPLEERVAEGLRKARAFSLVEGESQLGLTPVGRITAFRGLSFETAQFFSEWVNRFEGKQPPDLLALLVAACTQEAEGWAWPRDRAPEWRGYWVERVRQQLGWEPLRSLGRHWAEWGAVSPRSEDAAKMACGLLDWARGESLAHLREMMPGLSPGTLHAAGEGARWLLDSLADIWQALGGEDGGQEGLRILSRCAGCGLPEWALDWESIPSDLLDRDRKMQLAQILDHPRAILALRAEDLAPLLPPSRFEKVRSFVDGLFADTAADTSVSTSSPPNSREGVGLAPSLPPNPGKRGRTKSAVLLDSNLTEEGPIYLAATWKQKVSLGMRGAELLLRLVRGRLEPSGGGWVARERLGVDRESLSQRLSDLRARLGPPPPGFANWIENDRRGHYRLACPPESIRWNPAATPLSVQALLA